MTIESSTEAVSNCRVFLLDLLIDFYSDNYPSPVQSFL